MVPLTLPISRFPSHLFHATFLALHTLFCCFLDLETPVNQEANCPNLSSQTLGSIGALSPGTKLAPSVRPESIKNANRRCHSNVFRMNFHGDTSVWSKAATWVFCGCNTFFVMKRFWHRGFWPRSCGEPSRFLLLNTLKTRVKNGHFF